ncbi:hypothetical protein EC973_000007 [Apophysomyces ossiformis]|uniref:Inclusion body clearance protein IML2 n=1 Tax=Apophysomyces ossiformis TaxID=679940 RepID=A0A8H7BWB1_9FUNG|nr:hypothetical protein EC973_000007 [Apophysomyces ossiformis]
MQPTLQQVELWIADAHHGLEALFNDQVPVARFIFEQRSKESPFHAAGFALLGFVEATLDGFATAKLQGILDQIQHAENLARRYAKKHQQHSKGKEKEDDDDDDHGDGDDDNNDDDEEGEEEEDDDDDMMDDTDSQSSRETVASADPPKKHQQQHRQQQQGGKQAGVGRGAADSLVDQRLDFQYRLLVVSCMVMSVTLELLKENWMDSMKAVYKLRKIYRTYEHMFQTMTGRTTAAYANQLPRLPSGLSDERKGNNKNSSASQRRHHLDEGDRQETLRRSMTWSAGLKVRRSSVEDMVEGGVYLGLGLFSLILSLLPPKVSGILKTFGIGSSSAFAIRLLKMAHRIQGMHTPLAGLALVSYYTSLPWFIHPDLLPVGLRTEDARLMLEKLKASYPANNLWKLLEGKMDKIEGRVERSLSLLREARRRSRQDEEDDTSGHAHDAIEQKKYNYSLCGLIQFQLCTIYEIGWTQMMLGHWFDAAEQFFQLESMSNRSTVFYHYIASCCMFADGAVDKAALEFLQIPRMLERKRQLRAKICPNEAFAERQVQRWIHAAEQKKKTMKQQQAVNNPSSGHGNNNQNHNHNHNTKTTTLTGTDLKHVMDVHPVWELLYLSNSLSQLPRPFLETMQNQLEDQDHRHYHHHRPVALLLLAVVLRELGSYDRTDQLLEEMIESMQGQIEGAWVVPYAMYEIAILRCLQRKTAKDPLEQQKRQVEARDWIQRTEQFFELHPSGDAISDWEDRLFIRCQLLSESLDESF